MRMCWAFCISSKEIRIFLNEEMWREVPLGCLGSRLSWFPRGNLCLVRENSAVADNNLGLALAGGAKLPANMLGHQCGLFVQADIFLP